MRVNRNRVLVGVLAGAALGSAGSRARAQVNYSLTPLYSGSYQSITTQGISQSGEVVGFYVVTDPQTNGPADDSFTAIITPGTPITGGTNAIQTTGNVVDDDTPTNVAHDPLDAWGTAINSNSSNTLIAGASQLGSGYGAAVGPATPSPSGTGLTNLGNYGNPVMTFATGINDSGVVVGTGNAANTLNHAFVEAPDSSGNYSQISTANQLDSSSLTSVAYGITNTNAVTGLDLIVGFSGGTKQTSASTTNAALNKTATEWSFNPGNGTVNVVTIANPSSKLNGGSTSSTDQSVAYAINKQGDFAGVAQTAHGTQAFLELSDDHTVIDLNQANDQSISSFGTLGSPFKYIWDSTGVNSEPASGAFNVFNNGLGNTNSLAEAMTDEQNGMIEIVGSIGSGVNKVAALWTVNVNTQQVTETDLNALYNAENPGYWILEEATGINDAGQITGYGGYDSTDSGLSGEEAAFVLTPASVPEPATSMLAAGSVGLLLKRRRK